MARRTTDFDRLVYVPLVAIEHMLRWLPLGLARRLAALLVRLVAVGDLKYYRKAVRSAQTGLGVSRDEAKRVIKRSLRNLGYTVAELIHLPRLDDDWIRSNARITNGERLREALAEGRGVVAVSLHVGNYELGAARLILEGFPIAALSRPRSNPVLQRLIHAVHLRTGLNVIPAGSPRRLVEALRDNQCIVFMYDQNVRQPDLFVRFLGRWASATALPARLARKHKCPVLSLVSIRRENNSQEVIVGPPIQVPVTDDENADVLLLAARMAERVDHLMREWANQHLWWLYDRWGTQPQDAPQAPLVEPDGYIRTTSSKA